MRTLQRGAALAAAAAFVGALVGCNKGSANTDPGGADSTANIATVNGAPVTVNDFYVELQAYRPQPNQAAMEPDGIITLRKMISDSVMEQLARKDGVYPTDAQIDEQMNNMRMVMEKSGVDTFDVQLQQQGLTEDYVKRLHILPQLCQLNVLSKGLTVTDADAKAYYDRHLVDMFTKPARAHIKRMLLTTQEEAREVSDQLAKGGSFESLYETHSFDKQLVGGDYPQWLPLDDPNNPAAKPLFDAIRATPPGKTTPPIQYQGSWWIVEVVEKRPREVFDFNSAKSMVRMAMTQQMITSDESRYTVLEQDLRNAMMSADIEITEPRYQTLIESMKNPPAIPAAPAPQPQPQQGYAHPSPRPQSGKPAQ